MKLTTEEDEMRTREKVETTVASERNQAVLTERNRVLAIISDEWAKSGVQRSVDATLKEKGTMKDTEYERTMILLENIIERITGHTRQRRDAATDALEPTPATSSLPSGPNAGKTVVPEARHASLKDLANVGKVPDHDGDGVIKR